MSDETTVSLPVVVLVFGLLMGAATLGARCQPPPCSASPGMDRSQVIDVCGVPEKTADSETRSWWTYGDVVVEFEGNAVRSVTR